MLDKNCHISELYDLMHRHDTKITEDRYDYENKLFSNSFSDYIFKNDTTNEFLTKLQNMQVLMLESILLARNFFNYTVSKYYDRHNN